MAKDGLAAKPCPLRSVKMPYKKVSELPESVRDNLPMHAQEIYKEAFNSAWDQYDEPEERRGDASREETAHRVAWSAVKKQYEKSNGKWVKKG
jgi:cation transport regulator